jgi:hypothetical protein
MCIRTEPRFEKQKPSDNQDIAHVDGFFDANIDAKNKYKENEFSERLCMINIFT